MYIFKSYKITRDAVLGIDVAGVQLIYINIPCLLVHLSVCPVLSGLFILHTAVSRWPLRGSFHYWHSNNVFV